MKLQDLTFIDLFCGIGAYHKVLKEFNCKCVFSSEIDKHAAKYYEVNHGMKPHGDITKIKAEDIPAHDILCAGFPCQPFSIAGKGLGFNHAMGDLFNEILRIVGHHRPKILLLENANTLLTMNNGQTYEVIKSNIKALGYKVFAKVLKANDYGLPTNRKRAFLVCFKDLNVQFEFPKPRPLNTHLIDLLEQNPQNIRIFKRADLTIERQLNDRCNKLVRLGYFYKPLQGYKIYSPLGISAAFTKSGGGLGRQTGLYLINDQVRNLSPRECARVMGFSDDFILGDNRNIACSLLGNSIAINCIRAILQQIRSMP